MLKELAAGWAGGPVPQAINLGLKHLEGRSAGLGLFVAEDVSIGKVARVVIDENDIADRFRGERTTEV